MGRVSKEPPQSNGFPPVKSSTASYAGDGEEYGMHDAEEHHKTGFSGSARFSVQGHGQPAMTADGEAVPAQRASWARASLLQPLRSQRTVSADADTGEAAHTGIGPPDAPRRDLAEPVRHQPERTYGKANSRRNRTGGSTAPQRAGAAGRAPNRAQRRPRSERRTAGGRRGLPA